MFRTAMCPSSGALTVTIPHLVYVTLCRWPSGVEVWMYPNLHTRRSSTQIDIYQMRFNPPYQKVIYTDWHMPDGIQTSISEGHLHRLIYTRWDQNLHTRRSSTQIDIYQMGSKPSYQKVIYTDCYIPDEIQTSISEGHLYRLTYARWDSNLNTRRSSTQSDIYQMSYWYN